MIDVVHIAYPGVGGVAGVAIALAKEAVRQGESHAIVFYGIEPPAEAYLATCVAANIRTESVLKAPGIGLGARLRLLGLLRNLRAPAVIAHIPDTAVTASVERSRRRWSSSRMVVLMVEHHPIPFRSSKDWMVSGVAHRLSDRSVYLTEGYREEVMRRLGPFFDESRSKVIPNGIDLSRFPRYEPRSGDLREVVVGMQGRMERAKDFATVIRAIARGQGVGGRVFRLELIGDGPDRPGLEALAGELGVADLVTFRGRLAPDAVLDRMAEWDIAVLSTRGETLSLTMLEAWALGVPLVSTRVSGVAGFAVDGKDALLVSFGNDDEMMHAINRLAAEPLLRASMSHRGLDRTRSEFSIEAVWSTYRALLDHASGSSDSGLLPKGPATFVRDDQVEQRS